jgi:CO/xanthine dehydrogenase Mo-binding subunit
VKAATGLRMTHLPISPPKLLAALEATEDRKMAAD